MPMACWNLKVDLRAAPPIHLLSFTYMKRCHYTAEVIYCVHTGGGSPEPGRYCVDGTNHCVAVILRIYSCNHQMNVTIL